MGTMRGSITSRHPVDDDGLKETAQRYLTPGSLAHKIAVEGWNTYQRIQSVFATGSSDESIDRRQT